jgi:hypothetical protein
MQTILLSRLIALLAQVLVQQLEILLKREEGLY